MKLHKQNLDNDKNVNDTMWLINNNQAYEYVR